MQALKKQGVETPKLTSQAEEKPVKQTGTAQQLNYQKVD
jgi:hypothetical protein